MPNSMYMCRFDAPQLTDDADADVQQAIEASKLDMLASQVSRTYSWYNAMFPCYDVSIDTPRLPQYMHIPFVL